MWYGVVIIGSITSFGTAFIISVSVIPGATALTRIPLGPSSLAKDTVKPFTANFDAECMVAKGNGVILSTSSMVSISGQPSGFTANFEDRKSVV